MKHPTKPFALCLDNADDKVSLSLGKVYRIIPEEAAKDGLVRVVDESGEDYLFHKSLFIFVDCPQPIAKSFDHLKPPA